MKQLIDIIHEKLIITNKIYKNNYDIVLYTDIYHPEKILDALDQLYGRSNHNIKIDIYNYTQDAYKDYTTTFTYDNIDDVVKLCVFIELLFGVTKYEGDFDNTEDMCYFIRDSKLIIKIGLEKQTELDRIFQDYNDKWSEIYIKCLRK
jgi:hypothetical protein